jgi:preprotein translocase SecE subunit
MADIKKQIVDKEAKQAQKAEAKAAKLAARAKAREARLAMTPEEKKSRVMEILKKEYKFENWLLAILSPVLILYGVYIITGKFGSVDLTAILGESGIGFIDWFFNTDLKRILTGTFLIVVGTLVIVYLLIPVFRPSIAEMKKVTFPTGKILGIDSLRVFGFLLFLMVVFILYGFALDPLFKWLYSL